MSKKSGTVVAFGDVVALHKERTNDPDAEGFSRYVGLDHLDPGDLRIRRWGDVADGTTFTNVFRPGHVLFGKRRAYQGKVAVAGFSGVCSGDIYVLKPKSDLLLPGLLPFVCLSSAFRQHAIGTSAGSLSPRTSWKSLAGFEFRLPTRHAQSELVSVLEAARSTGEAYERLVSSMSLVRPSILDSVLREHTSQDSKRPLGDLATVTSGGTPSRREPSYWEGGIPWLKTGEIDFGWIDQTEETITEAGLANSAAKLADQGAIVMALYGQGPTLGRVGRLRIQAATNQACAVIAPQQGVDASFLFHYLSRQYKSIRRLARGASQPNLTLGIVKSIEVPLPPFDVQVATAQVLDSVLEKQDIAEHRGNTAHDLVRLILDRSLSV